jgi:hypothetical protein
MSKTCCYGTRKIRQTAKTKRKNKTVRQSVVHSKNYSLSREGMAEGIFPLLLHWGIFPQIEEVMN